MADLDRLPDTWEEAGIVLPRHGGSGHPKTKCPKCQPPHDPHDNPLYVSVDLGVWKCYHCEWKGRLSWASKNDDWRDAIRPKREYRLPPIPAQEERQLSPRAMAWFEKRGIDPELAMERGVYSDHHFVDEKDGRERRYGDRTITFPYVSEDGEVVHLKHRSISDKRFWSSAGTELILWNVQNVDRSIFDAIIICEGEMDVLAMEQAGIFNAVSVPNGAPNPVDKHGNPIRVEYRMEYLNAHEDLIKATKQIIIATDMDEPGRALANEIARRVGPEKCSIVEWPDGCKDANDVLMSLGPRAVAAGVATARPVPVEGLYTGYDLEAGLVDMYDNGVDRGVGFGFPILDNYYRVKTGYLTVVTGIPGMGKSTVLDALLVLLAHSEDWKHTMFSPEQQPIEWHHAQLIEQRVGMSFWEDQMGRMSKETMLDASVWVSNHFSYLLPPKPTIDAILELADLEVYRKGIRGIVIDPWNEIEHARPAGISETEYISNVLAKFRYWLRNRGVHGWMVAHPTKQTRNKETLAYDVPDLYSISGGANWYNKADFGLVIHREGGQKSDEVDIHILKSRRRELATIGQVRFRYLANSKRIIELPREEQPMFLSGEM